MVYIVSFFFFNLTEQSTNLTLILTVTMACKRNLPLWFFQRLLLLLNENNRYYCVKGKGVLFNVGCQRKPESLFPVEPTVGVFTSPAPSLG